MHPWVGLHCDGCHLLAHSRGGLGCVSRACVCVARVCGARLRTSLRPPRFDEKLATLATTSLPYAALLHSAMAVWMYSEPRVLLTEKHEDLRLLRLRTSACAAAMRARAAAISVRKR